MDVEVFCMSLKRLSTACHRGFYQRGRSAEASSSAGSSLSPQAPGTHSVLVSSQPLSRAADDTLGFSPCQEKVSVTLLSLWEARVVFPP